MTRNEPVHLMCTLILFINSLSWNFKITQFFILPWVLFDNYYNQANDHNNLIRNYDIFWAKLYHQVSTHYCCETWEILVYAFFLWVTYKVPIMNSKLACDFRFCWREDVCIRNVMAGRDQAGSFLMELLRSVK